jgi:hypothetical protein
MACMLEVMDPVLAEFVIPYKLMRFRKKLLAYTQHKRKGDRVPGCSREFSLVCEREFLSSSASLASRPATLHQQTPTSGIRAGCGLGLDYSAVSPMESLLQDRVGDDGHLNRRRQKETGIRAVRRTARAGAEPRMAAPSSSGSFARWAAGLATPSSPGCSY